MPESKRIKAPKRRFLAARPSLRALCLPPGMTAPEPSLRKRRWHTRIYSSMTDEYVREQAVTPLLMLENRSLPALSVQFSRGFDESG